MFDQLLATSYAWLLPLIQLVLAGLAGFVLFWGIFKGIHWYGERRDSLPFQSFNRNLRRPARFLGVVVGLNIAIAFIEVSERVAGNLSILFESLIYVFGGWALIELTDVVSDLVRDRYRLTKENNLTERKIITQFQYIKRVVSVVVFIVAVAFILLQFDKVRELGTGLLTSAGVAGIIIGLAAQKSIANLLAGFQLAFTQPIRIDDVVIVENEWGRVEEITLTYVVVRIWDERRLVVPLNYFNEKPFQNWTRSSSQLLAYVFLYTDYRVPVDALRQKFTELLEGNPLWDQRVNVVQVTNADRHTMEIRALTSARNASEAWDLRCQVREGLITFIQKEYPESLPRTRVEWAPFKEGTNAQNGAPEFTSQGEPSGGEGGTPD
ncbi:mechanosensitive ion channel domain-containing protein [Phaeodactylibacter sp.]|uniref:mechanosensitive ion channel family protein n=1 Tax=Phaeodactylibacter sp. TaxID=1940289 RepID=UPI0025F7E59A|nr:mechanosensitive ion channel domain-containing protein [Phaeodactylibacter sp.]MCI4650319.1 mechanosensitive ion channel family protein [Phaeodactylibacter sp.]MCI5093887.1 mechanosensitive ion channel family protein [Phaeodactylibacter sp.]